MTKLVDVLRKLDAVEDKCKRQLAMVKELRHSLVTRAMASASREGEDLRIRTFIALSQAERGVYDKMLADLMVDTKDAEVEG